MSDPASTGGSKKKWIVWGAIIVGLFVAFQFLPIAEWLRFLREWIDSIGLWGPLAFVGIYFLASLLLLPGAAMTSLGGLLFGLGWGTVWVVVASNIAANVAFLIGRYFARDAVARRIEGNEKFAAVDRAVGNDGWKIVALTRLSPVFPFVLLNYAFGLTSVKWSHYALASLFGMLPGTVMYVYIGSLGQLAAESDEAGTGKVVMTVLGLVATIVVTVLITKRARKALAERADIEVE